MSQVIQIPRAKRISTFLPIDVKLFFRKLFIKISSWEYWPTHLVYIPVFLFYPILAIRSKSFFFFSAVNPTIETGGLYAYSKYDLLKQLGHEWTPNTMLIKKSKKTTADEVLGQAQKNNIQKPFIIKPDVGERGKGVALISSKKQLEEYLKGARGSLIVQSYIDYPFEAGVFYYRFPEEENGKISSIATKKFLKITGDGSSTIYELLEKNDRAVLVLDKIEKKMGKNILSVPLFGEEVMIEPIGNHNRGTAFIDSNHLINDRLHEVFDEIAKQIPDFYYGRFDLRAASEDDFLSGVNLKIVEVNGVNSEPAHIYHPSASLLKGWHTLIQYWLVIYKISIQNRKKGVKPISYQHAKRLYQYWKNTN
jgi:hypothetical protein